MKMPKLKALKIKWSSDMEMTCGSVLNNLSDEEKVSALKEIRRVLKPRGKFLLIEPLRNLRALFLFTLFGFWKLLSKQEWQRLLEEQGFAVVGYRHRHGMGFFCLRETLKFQYRFAKGS